MDYKKFKKVVPLALLRDFMVIERTGIVRLNL